MRAGRFLIDESLSPVVVGVATASGFQAERIQELGLAMMDDAAVRDLALANGAMLVTNNARDFRRFYAAVTTHPGLVIVRPNVNRDAQAALFRSVLTALGRIDTLAGMLLEVQRTGEVRLRRWNASDRDPAPPWRWP
jgi:predicted nuclease of predicted toxin-antitoxin system